MCDWNEKLKTGVDVRDIGRVLEVADREAGRERVERISVLIHAMGGDWKGYRREKAKAARNIVFGDLLCPTCDGDGAPTTEVWLGGWIGA